MYYVKPHLITGSKASNGTFKYGYHLDYWINTYSDEAYDLPFDVIFYLESPWNYKQNEYVREHLQEIEDYINDNVRSYNFFFRYKLRYMSRQEADIFPVMKELYPELKGFEALPRLKRTFRQLFQRNDKESRFKRGLEKKWEERYRKMMFMGRLFPGDAEGYQYLIFDSERIDTDYLLSALCTYVHLLADHNREILDTGHPEQYHTEPEYWAAFGREADVYYPTPSIRFSIASRDDRKPTPEEIRLEEEERRREEEERRLKDLEDRRLAAIAREKALALKAQLEAFQMEYGDVVFAEIFGTNFIRQLRKGLPGKVSSLVVDSQYRILLPDYDREIEMSVLPKALYILFLRHPDGIARESLDDYRDELRTIYLTLSPRSDVSALCRSVDDLVEPGSDSLNQKISRINAAFRKSLASDLAQHYIISGPRGEAKRILVASSAQLPEEFRF